MNNETPNKCLKAVTTVFFLTVFLTSMVYYVVAANLPLVVDLGEKTRITDGVYYLFMTKAFWFDQKGNVYNMFTQLGVMSDIVNRPSNFAMPLNILPSALVIWLPFSLVLTFNLKLAYALWMGFSFALLFYALEVFFCEYPVRNQGRHWPIVFFVSVVVFSLTTGASLILGQTSIIHTACLIMLLTKTRSKEEKSYEQVLSDIFFLFVLSMKPQFLLLGIGVLLIQKRYKSLLYSLIMILATLIVLTPLLGREWIGDYLNALLLYKGGTISAVYRDAFVVDRMNIFRVAFGGLIGERVASNLSWVALIGFYILSTGIVFLRDCKARMVDSGDSKSFRLFWITFLIGSYLLFAPHSGFYEEILLLVVMVSTYIAVGSMKIPSVSIIIIAASTALVVNRFGACMACSIMLEWWLLKLMLITSLLYYSWQGSLEELKNDTLV